MSRMLRRGLAAAAFTAALSACAVPTPSAPLAATDRLAAPEVAALVQNGATFRSTVNPVVYRLQSGGALRIEVTAGNQIIPGTWQRSGDRLCITPDRDAQACYVVATAADGRYRFQDTASGQVSEDFEVVR